MSSWQHAHNLMVAIGDRMELPQVTEYADHHGWYLGTDSGPVEVDYDETTDRILLTAPIGTAPEGGRERLYEALLVHNGAVAADGVRAGLEELGGEVVLLLERRAHGLDAGGLQTAIEHLLATASVWAGRLEHHHHEAARSGIDLLHHHMIRG